ncbi:MAG: hypothetical protein PHI91_03185 [Candidatus Pacebacteria bacterium]|jgi:hypothetical protein|nr:hypothetical protein [Candidatus Paceibacterota bacterium]MDD2757607.1 hypothetical protein [Candidatus Paceibacterota bacterium]MDD3970163.1 hypothetical protein [Candidatus Paceibacterota bacterium]
MNSKSLPELQRDLEDVWFMNTKQGKHVENPIKTPATEELRVVFRNLQHW